MSLALASRKAALLAPWNRNRLWALARAVPSLDLRFADNKSLTDAVTGASLVTFTRASSGTFIDSARVLQTAATNEPRFDHNPTTGEGLGLLVEEARTNLLLRSEELDNASWSRTGLSSVTANATAAPDGNVTAESLVETTGVSEVHRVLQTISVTSGTTYSASAYFKQEGRRYGYITLGPNATWNSLGVSAYIDLQTGTAQSITNCTAVVQALPGSWYRLTITATPTATNALASMILGVSSTGSTQTFIGDGRTAISVWGAQLEAGAFATSYIPTTTAAATRSADAASITGTNFSSWYRQDEGTLYAEYIIFAPNNDGTVTSFDNGTANNRWQQRFTTAGQRYRLDSGGVSLVDDIGAGVPLVNATNKVAHTIRSGDQRYARNGALNANVLTASPLPTVTQLQLGAGSAAGNAARIIIRRLTYWPQRLANSTLQAITQ